MAIGSVRRVAGPRPLGVRTVRSPLWSTQEAFYTELLLFTLVLSGLYTINLVGALPGCEVLVLPLLPALLLARGERAFKREHLWFLIWVVAWLFGTLVSDTVNDIAFFNRAKGTARVVFFALDFLALAIFINNKARRIVVFALAYAAVLLAGSYNFSGDFNLQWKFGVSEGSAVLAMLISSFYFGKRRYGICFLISLIWAALNLRYGFRSQLAIQCVAAALTLPLFGEPRKTRSGIASGQTPARVVVTVVLVGLAAYVANTSIKFAVRSGLFDESTASKFEGQNKGDFGVLVGGRPETLVAIQAILDRPVIGHGSFAEGEKYLWLKQQIQYEHGYSDTEIPEEGEYNTIPTHSHLTLAWVEGGVLGGLCWIYILLLTLRALLKLTFLRPNLAPLYAYILTGFLWDILYSPFGSVNRIWAAFYVLICYHVLGAASKKTQEIRKENRRLLALTRESKPKSKPILPRIPYRAGI